MFFLCDGWYQDFPLLWSRWIGNQGCIMVSVFRWSPGQISFVGIFELCWKILKDIVLGLQLLDNFSLPALTSHVISRYLSCPNNLFNTTVQAYRSDGGVLWLKKSDAYFPQTRGKCCIKFSLNGGQLLLHKLCERLIWRQRTTGCFGDVWRVFLVSFSFPKPLINWPSFAIMLMTRQLRITPG